MTIPLKAPRAVIGACSRSSSIMRFNIGLFYHMPSLFTAIKINQIPAITLVILAAERTLASLENLPENKKGRKKTLVARKNKKKKPTDPAIRSRLTA